jgi:hypothetical protein
MTIPPEDPESIRLVIQRIGEASSRRSSYRLIGYSNRRTYQPVGFRSLDERLKALKAGLPELDTSRVQKEGRAVPSILFSDVVELSQEQLSILGFRK